MEDKKYSELSSYFTFKEWKNMSEYERSHFYNKLENYKVMHSLGLTTKTPDFMRVKKRESEEENWPPKRKHVKYATKMKSRRRVVPSNKESASLFNPSPDELAHDVQEDLLPFPEADYVGETAALSASNEAIKKPESEIQNTMEAGEPIQFHSEAIKKPESEIQNTMEADPVFKLL